MNITWQQGDLWRVDGVKCEFIDFYPMNGLLVKSNINKIHILSNSAYVVYDEGDVWLSSGDDAKTVICKFCEEVL